MSDLRSVFAPRIDVISGAEAIFGTSTETRPLWGSAEDIAWMEGEPLLITSPPGIGKTTLAGELILRRTGIRGGDLFSYPVEVSNGRTLYIDADRPKQIRRSFRRMVEEADSKALAASLIFSGPLPFDLSQSTPGDLAGAVDRFSEVDTVVIDSLGACAMGLSKDEVGARVNAELQRLVATGIEVVVLHHQRKATGENRKPKTLADVYGSTWITTGAGSVLLLWGSPDSPIVELSTLKHAIGDIGPLTLRRDDLRGTFDLHDGGDLEALVASNGGVTVRDAACHLSGTQEPSRADIQRARRKLEALQGIERLDENPVRYRIAA